MTDAELSSLLDQYRAGLEAEIAILHRLEETAAQQREATAAADLQALQRASDARDASMAALVSIESDLRDVRQRLSKARDAARRLPGYHETAALHQTAVDLVARILRADRDSMEALAAAELARRDFARAVAAGETTLAAYRRAMTTLPGATLVDRRG